MASHLLLAVVVGIATLPPAHGKGFLTEPSQIDAGALSSKLSEAMGTALGCGSQVDDKALAVIERDLMPMWRSLHKNAEGRVERRTLRYLVHRYFNRRSGLHIRGFEPSRPTNVSGWSDMDILSQRVPAYVESILESKHRTVAGFDLRDAALVVATIQQLVLDSESDVLQQAYRAQSKSMSAPASEDEVRAILSSYMLRWMTGAEESIAKILSQNRSKLVASVPHWELIESMAGGLVAELEYKRQQDPVGALADGTSRPGYNPLSQQYSFEDVHKIVGDITMTFASFWESECQHMKGQLVNMDTLRTGRVPLARFYSSALDSEWRFGESEGYLRELGALDETGGRGKQVIIANYIQGASNCIVSSPHYLVCCTNECETLLGELEAAVGGPEAAPSQLLELVGRMSSQTSLDDDFPPALAGSLSQSLQSISDVSGGSVPLHGRLFAQWLHYAFPRECAYPYKVGATKSLTPTEFGDDYLAKSGEMERHAAAVNASAIPVNFSRDELQWMSQWSAEEELVSEQIRAFQSPVQGRSHIVCCILFVLVVGLGLTRVRGKAMHADPWQLHQRAHLV